MPWTALHENVGGFFRLPTLLKDKMLEWKLWHIVALKKIMLHLVQQKQILWGGVQINSHWSTNKYWQIAIIWQSESSSDVNWRNVASPSQLEQAQSLPASAVLREHNLCLRPLPLIWRVMNYPAGPWAALHLELLLLHLHLQKMRDRVPVHNSLCLCESVNSYSSYSFRTRATMELSYCSHPHAPTPV